MAAARRALAAHDGNIAEVSSSLQNPGWEAVSQFGSFTSTDDYLSRREQVLRREKALDFDWACRA